MNTAMMIYRKHFYDNQSDARLFHVGQIAVKECKDKFNENGNTVYVFEDKSRLVFTSDNVQVSFF